MGREVRSGGGGGYTGLQVLTEGDGVGMWSGGVVLGGNLRAKAGFRAARREARRWHGSRPWGEAGEGGGGLRACRSLTKASPWTPPLPSCAGPRVPQSVSPPSSLAFSTALTLAHTRPAPTSFHRKGGASARGIGLQGWGPISSKPIALESPRSYRPGVARAITPGLEPTHDRRAEVISPGR
jgi:hypothetical protein